jgi:hypothetical protein
MSTSEGGGDIVKSGLVFYVDAANPRSIISGSTIWNDLLGQNNGTLTNGPIFNSGNGGNILFDGLNTYVESGRITPTMFTLSSWFRATGIPTNNDTTGGVLIVSSPQLFGGAIQFGLTYSWANQKCVFLTQVNIGANSTADNTVLRNTIYNVTGTYNGTRSQIYINGVLINDISWTTNPIYPTTGNMNVQIGRWGYPGFTRHFNGNIYQTSIYNRALSASEVLQNFNATKSRFGL